MKNIIAFIIFWTFTHVHAEIIIWKNSNNCADEKTIEVLASGSGKTQAEAINEALISALQTVCGAYISSKVVVESDQIIANNITSLTSGAVAGYKIVHSSQSNNQHHVTVKANINQSGVINFVKAKTTSEISVDGNSYLDNIKLLEIKKNAEKKILKNIYEVYVGLILKSIEFKIDSIKPKYTSCITEERDYNKVMDREKRESCVELDLYISKLYNSNIILADKYLVDNLTAISLNENEVQLIKQSNSNNYSYYKYEVTFAKKKKDLSTSTFLLRNDNFYNLFKHTINYSFNLRIADNVILSPICGTHKYDVCWLDKNSEEFKYFNKGVSLKGDQTYHKSRISDILILKKKNLKTYYFQSSKKAFFNQYHSTMTLPSFGYGTPPENKRFKRSEIELKCSLSENLFRNINNIKIENIFDLNYINDFLVYSY
ncbi:MAG: hypothetical protein ACK5CL_07835 [Sphingomonadales bacterium]|jgi:hypothetical protein